MARIFPGHSFTSPLRGDGGNPQSSGMSPHPANLHASSAGAGKVHPHPYKEDGYNQIEDWGQSRASDKTPAAGVKSRPPEDQFPK